MNINKIKLSGTTYNIQDENATKTVELTQAQYDALAVKDPNTFYIITDATGADLSNYYTKSETSGATQISTALASKQTTLTAGTNITIVDNVISATGGGGSSYTAGDGIDITNDVISVTGKVDTTTYNTYTAETNTAIANKQDTLVSGSNIKTINDVSILGSGNITIEGGGSGKAVSAGTNISITTGETADTINCTLPFEITNSYSVTLGGFSNTNKGVYCYFGGHDNVINNYGSGHYIIGDYNKIGLTTSEPNFYNTLTVGEYNINRGGVVFGRYNSSSDTTLFSVGNGTSDSARHNAFEIRQNGDIYCSDGTNDVKLQDTITATAANTTALGGLKLVKLSQSEYDALSPNYDSNTLYIINE